MRTLKILIIGMALLGLAVAGIYSGFCENRSPAQRTAVIPPEVSRPADATPPGGYSVTLSPCGTVTFRKIPARVVTLDANYDDMLETVACGKKIIAAGYPHNLYRGFYRQIPGFTPGVNPQKIRFLGATAGNTFDKELLYELHADLHHIDPLQLQNMRGWTREDVAEIARNVGPFFANRFSRDNNYKGGLPYEYYDIWQLADKTAQVYRRAETIHALKTVYDRLCADIQAKLPPIEKRPRVALLIYGKGRCVPFRITGKGFGQAQYLAVGARDAFAGRQIKSYGDSGPAGAGLDWEGMLAIDPEVIIVPFAILDAPGHRAAYEEFAALKNDPLARRLRAFQNGRVYPGGTPLQGPLFHLFQIEMAAKQIYPEIFGRYRDDQNYPANEQLFRRAEIAAILRNNPKGQP